MRVPGSSPFPQSDADISAPGRSKPIIPNPILKWTTTSETGPRCQGGRVGVAAGWAARRRSIGGGHGDLLENGEAAAQTRAEHTTGFRQSTSRPAARFPSAACRELSNIGRPRRPGSSAPGSSAPGSSAPGRRIQGRGRAAGAGRAGGISGLDAGGWPAPAAAVALCRCPLLHQQRSHRGWRRPFPRRGAKVGVDAYTGEVSRRDVLGGLMHEDHAVTA
jgi:hypothetical protein